MDYSNAASVFGLLKNPHRLRILTVLSKEEMSVKRLAEAVSLKQPALSHHLRHLKDAGLVRMRREGSFHLFQAEELRAAPFLRHIERERKNGDELIYVWDIASGEQLWYGDVDGAFGFRPGEFPRTVQAWEERVHPADYQRVIDAAEAHLSSGAPFCERYRVRKADGSYVEWLDSGSAVRDASKRPYKWVGMTREIA